MTKQEQATVLMNIKKQVAELHQKVFLTLNLSDSPELISELDPFVRIEKSIQKEVKFLTRIPKVNEIQTIEKKYLHPIQKFCLWLPHVLKIESQLTGKQCVKLIEDYTQPQIESILLDLENNRGCEKKYNNVYLTVRKWLVRQGTRSVTLEARKTAELQLFYKEIQNKAEQQVKHGDPNEERGMPMKELIRQSMH